MHYCIPLVGDVFWQKTNRDFSSVERMNGDEVKNCECYAKQNERGKEKLEYCGQSYGVEEERKYTGSYQVARGTCQRDGCRVPAGVFEVVWVKLNRFSPAKAGNQQHERSQGIKVSERVEGEAALRSWSGIAEPISHPGVRKLMNGNGGDQRNGGKQEEEGIGEECGKHVRILACLFSCLDSSDTIPLYEHLLHLP